MATGEMSKTRKPTVRNLNGPFTVLKIDKCSLANSNNYSHFSNMLSFLDDFSLDKNIFISKKDGSNERLYISRDEPISESKRASLGKFLANNYDTEEFSRIASELYQSVKIPEEKKRYIQNHMWNTAHKLYDFKKHKNTERLLKRFIAKTDDISLMKYYSKIRKEDEDDGGLREHTVGIMVGTLKLAQELKLSEDDIHQLTKAALHHDGGKQLIDKKVYLKSSRLFENEWEQTKSRILNYAPRNVAKKWVEKLEGINYQKGDLNDEQIAFVNKVARTQVKKYKGIKGAFSKEKENLLSEKYRKRLSIQRGNLDGSEWAEIEKHPYYSYLMIKDNPFLNREAKAADLLHHVKYDRKNGYPSLNDVKIENILLNELYPECNSVEELPEKMWMYQDVIHLMDVFDALNNKKRVYRNPQKWDEIVEILRKGSGSDFNPLLVDSLLNIVEEDEILGRRIGGGYDSSISDLIKEKKISNYDDAKKYMIAKRIRKVRLAYGQDVEAPITYKEVYREAKIKNNAYKLYFELQQQGKDTTQIKRNIVKRYGALEKPEKVLSKSYIRKQTEKLQEKLGLEDEVSNTKVRDLGSTYLNSDYSHKDRVAS